MCWLCEATKGNSGDLSKCFTDISPTAMWRRTFCRSFPWNISPNYSLIRGFHISMVVPDLLHVWNLGVARDVIGSTLKTILSETVVFNAPTLPTRLLLATLSLRQFAKQNRYPLRLKKLTRAKLIWKSKAYPGFASSGYDAFVVMRWLESILVNHTRRYMEIATLLWCSNQAISLMYSAGQFLTQIEKDNLDVLGGMFISLFLSMAKKALDEHKLMWRVKPKLHLLCHMFSSPRFINQSFYSTWMDEDYLKKVGKTLSLTPMKTAQKRLLQRWCLSIPKNLD